MVGESSHGGKALYGSSGGKKAIAPVRDNKLTYLEDTNDLDSPPWARFTSQQNRQGLAMLQKRQTLRNWCDKVLVGN